MLLQLRLSRLDPSTFAVPYYSLQPPSSLSESGLSSPVLGHVCKLTSGLVVGLPSFAAPLTQDTVLSGTDAAAPPASLQRRTFPFELGSQEALREEATLKVETASPDNAAIQQRAKEAWQAYLGLVNEGRKAVQKAEAERNKQSPSPGDHLLVTTTGTGSATPSKYRNGTF